MHIDKKEYSAMIRPSKDEVLVIIPKSIDGWREAGELLFAKSESNYQFAFNYIFSHCTGNEDVEADKKPYIELNNAFGVIKITKEWDEINLDLNDFLHELFPGVEIMQGKWELKY
jgi:hypothetical protein